MDNANYICCSYLWPPVEFNSPPVPNMDISSVFGVFKLSNDLFVANLGATGVPYILDAVTDL